MENIDIQSVIDAISENKNIDKKRVEDALRLAFIRTAREVLGKDKRFSIELSGKTPTVYEVLTIVGNDTKRLQDGEIRLQDAIDKFAVEDIEEGDEYQISHDLNNYGRYALENLYANIERTLEETKGYSLYFEFKNRIGEKIKGKVSDIDENGNTIIDIDNLDVRVLLKKKDRIKGERFRVGDIVASVIKYVTIDSDNKLTVDVSRTHPKFLHSLFKVAVPEIADGVVTIEGISRIPGDRSKVAVRSSNPRVDAISTIIGTKGVRINSVSRELNGEIIDVINYSQIKEVYIKNSLSPAQIQNVKIGETEDIDGNKVEVAYVSIDRSERGKAIGKNGANLRLAKMLTGIEIRVLTSDTREGQIINESVDKKKSVDDLLGSLFK
ncbi:transcription termination factor NusA [Thiovulum sp. ES]|nr:transcription termination factor NusA [Thiovulum sp. ES]